MHTGMPLMTHNGWTLHGTSGQHINNRMGDTTTNKTGALKACICVINAVDMDMHYKRARTLMHVCSSCCGDIDTRKAIPAATGGLVNRAVRLWQGVNADIRHDLHLAHVNRHADDTGNMMADIMAGEAEITHTVSVPWHGRS